MVNPKSDRALDRVQVVFFDVDSVFTDGKTWQDSAGQWRRSFSVRDTMGVRALRKAGFRVVVLTPVISSEIKAHFEQIGVDLFKDQCLEPQTATASILKALGLTADQAAFVGEAVAGAVALRLNAMPSHAPIYITARKGGDGAVLEISNLILQHAGARAGATDISVVPYSLGEF